MEELHRRAVSELTASMIHPASFLCVQPVPCHVPALLPFKCLLRIMFSGLPVSDPAGKECLGLMIVDSTDDTVRQKAGSGLNPSASLMVWELYWEQNGGCPAQHQQT